MTLKRLEIKQKLFATAVIVVMLIMVLSIIQFKEILADTSVVIDVTVTTGGLSMSTVSSFSLPGITIGQATNARNNLLVVNAIDYRGNGLGWAVAMYTSNFNLTNAAIGTNNLSNVITFITPGTLGNYNSASHDGVAVGSGGSLNVSQTLFNASSGNGLGAYYLGNSLFNLVYNGDPALLAGNYISTSTVTIT